MCGYKQLHSEESFIRTADATADSRLSCDSSLSSKLGTVWFHVGGVSVGVVRPGQWAAGDKGQQRLNRLCYVIISTSLSRINSPRS